MFSNYLYYILDSFQNNFQFDAIYLDFRKAFDTVPHFELLTKLRNLGNTGKLFMWFHNYLSDRKQLVSINGCHSTVLPVWSGVPQGSILGPLLFLVYINDLPDVVSTSKVFLFADDTKCCLPITTPLDCDQLQENIDNLVHWSNKWNLHFNKSKCSTTSLKALP